MFKFLNVLKIKSSQKQYGNLQSIYESNESSIEEATYKQRIIKSYMTAAESARYCTSNASFVTPGKPKPYFVLTEKDRVKKAVNVTDNCEELNACLESNNVKNSSSKEYLSAAAAILAKINQLTKNGEIIGYTYSTELVNKFLTFKYSEQLSESELNHIWGMLTTTKDKINALIGILGDKYDLIPTSVRAKLLGFDNLFSTIAWRAVKYQLQKNESINETVFKGLTSSSEINEVLDNGKNLNGLDLTKELQIALIQRAIVMGNKPDGSKYIDELRADDGWLSGKDMAEKFQKYSQEVQEAGKKLDKEIAAKMEKKREEHARKAQANAALDAQISALKMKKQEAEIDFSHKRISYSEKCQIEKAADDEIYNLERKKV